jgi:adenylate cyclase
VTGTRGVRRGWRDWTKSGHFGRAVLLGVALGLGGMAASLVPAVLELDENVGLGALFAIRGPVSPPHDVVIVSISADAAAAMGQTSELDEWPRRLHAKLIDRLVDAGAAAVVFDVWFEEPREPAQDEQLAAAIRRAGNVLLFERLETTTIQQGPAAGSQQEQRVLPLNELKAAALGSAPFVLPTVPIRVAQFWTFGRAASDWPSLPVAAVQAYLLPHYEAFLALLERAQPGVTKTWPATREAVVAARELEGLVVSIRNAFQRDPQLATTARALLARAPQTDAPRALQVLLDLYAGPSSRYLNYYGPARSIPSIPYDRAVDGNGALDVAGKMVFVGFSESRQPDQQDEFYSVFSQRTGISLGGVEVGATAFANLLERRSLTALPMSAHLLLILALGVLLGVALGPLATRQVLLGGAVFAAAYAGVAYWAFAVEGTWLPLVVPLLAQLPVAVIGGVWRNYRELALQRQRVHIALGYYVPPAVARRLAEQSTAFGASRQLLHGTCLFTDAEQYTAVSEAIGPDELATLMNDYYSVLFRIVEQHGGEISDTAGDSMVAVWAAAKPDPTMRAQALAAAIAMLDAVDAFNRERSGRQLPTRIGLESGELVLGNIGAEQRYEYRAIGDIVNTAARIQGLNRVLGTRVLVSEATLAGDSDPPLRDLGTFLLRGKRLPVRVYEPLAATGVVWGPVGLAEFERALAAFRSGRFAEAHDGFVALAGRQPNDGPTRYYATLAEQYRRAAPAQWSGAVQLLVK